MTSVTAGVFSERARTVWKETGEPHGVHLAVSGLRFPLVLQGNLHPQSTKGRLQETKR